MNYEDYKINQLIEENELLLLLDRPDFKKIKTFKELENMIETEIIRTVEYGEIVFENQTLRTFNFKYLNQLLNTFENKIIRSNYKPQTLLAKYFVLIKNEIKSADSKQIDIFEDQYILQELETLITALLKYKISYKEYKEFFVL